MRRVKRILSYVLVLSMCFTLFFFPIKVLADESTYVVVPYATSYSGGLLIAEDSSNLYYIFTDQNNNEVRATFSKLDSNGYVFGAFVYAMSGGSNSNMKIAVVNKSSGNVTYRTDPDSTSYNSYYIYQMNLGFFADSNTTVYVNLLPQTMFGNTSNLNNTTRQYYYNYTFGDSAIDPEPPGPTYGRVADVEYATRIAGSGLASADNIDRIVWNQSIDTNGNDLPTGARVQIRAIPGKYVGNTANDVLTKTYTDFVLDHSKQLIIVDIIASRGVYETKWSEVVDHFGFFPYSWVPNIQYLDNEYFKMGWIYQIRLQVDDYYSDWQNIYTATGSGASESQTITDSDEISQQLVQDINIVNQLNNTTTTNWYINETTINNSEYTENTNGKPWWAYLLEAILSLFQIDDNNQQTINNTNNLNIDLNDKLNEYNEIEDQQLNNLDTNLEAIEVESDMLENNKFVGSANWVAQQYTRMTNGTVIGSLIGFSLLFGLALIFIGKIR